MRSRRERRGKAWVFSETRPRPGTGTFNVSLGALYPLTSIGIDLGLVSSSLGTCTVSTPLS